MKDDKIIRAVSDIDDAYILEAAPDSISRRRKPYIGVIAGLAAAAVLAATGLFAFGIIPARTGSAGKAAADIALTGADIAEPEFAEAENAVDELAEEKDYAVKETRAESAYTETRAAATAAGTYAAAEPEAPADTVTEENAAGVGEKNETAEEQYNQEEAGTEMIFEAAEMPDGAYFLLVYAAEERISIVESPEDFPFSMVGEADGATLYRAEKRPAELTLAIAQENGETTLYLVGPEDEREISEFFRNRIREADE